MSFQPKARSTAILGWSVAQEDPTQDEEGNVIGPQPSWPAPAARTGKLLHSDRPRGEQYRIKGRKEVILGMLDHEEQEQDEIHPAEQAVLFSLFREQINQAAEPQWQADRMHDENLLDQEL